MLGQNIVDIKAIPLTRIILKKYQPHRDLKFISSQHLTSPSFHP